MGSFLGQLGQKLAERWLTLLVLPGALYLAAASCARALGQRHPAATGRIAARITAWSHARAATTTAGQVLLLAAILAAAAAAGLAAQTVGAAVEHAALVSDWDRWPNPLRWLAALGTRRRQSQWDDAHKQYSTVFRAGAPAGVVLTDDDRDRLRTSRQTRAGIALERPQRPTWSGDRVNAAAVRLKRDRHVDLGTLWPHLWLAMPETTRSQVSEARQGLSRAATLGGWAVLYAALTWWWWPAAGLAAGLAVVARHRFRAAADVYATLLEAATTLHIRDLARAVGVIGSEGHADSGPVMGDALMDLMRTALPLAED